MNIGISTGWHELMVVLFECGITCRCHQLMQRWGCMYSVAIACCTSGELQYAISVVSCSTFLHLIKVAIAAHLMSCVVPTFPETPPPTPMMPESNS